MAPKEAKEVLTLHVKAKYKIFGVLRGNELYEKNLVKSHHYKILLLLHKWFLTPLCNAEYCEMTDIFQCEKSKTTCCSPKSAIFLSKKTKRLHLADKKNNEFPNFLIS